ncbi:hypothetical protein BBW65_00220 [Helicobacter enhydrae]|uniref:OmpA-like domain-containing protein n=1 Tax=Helicobacter enhydrae TaxID=222136 RepID=A0A1B1U3L5_9HELI|nr:flagellar motor protein MotB [Helicobacter enhydrae]ANV97339.1 hypothetical protein BBW65_00220 [Helicobacter enhydrae]
MSKKKKCPECPAGEKWAVPYADFLSLLLALFIALYAISAANTEKVKALKTEFVKIFDYAPKPEQTQPVLPIPPNPGEVKDITNGEESSSLKENHQQQQINESIAEIVRQGGVLEQIDEGVVLKMPTKLFFDPQSDVLQDQDSRLFLKRVAEIVKKLPTNVKIDIRGYAQNPNIKNTKYKTDYELAAARALNVMNTLIADGIAPHRIFFSSFGQFQPLNTQDSQKSIEQNNRVEFYFYVGQKQSKKIQELFKDLPPKIK